MKKTKITELLGITYPILQGGMLWLADAGLAGAVSNAGGLGVISPMAGMQPHGDPAANMANQIEQVRKLTTRPFGVNIPLDLRDLESVVDTVFSLEVPVVIMAAGDPHSYTELFKSTGTKVIQVIGSVKHARSAEDAGVDAVVAHGIEAAARNGFDELPAFSLIPQVADAVKVPVIAAGGIADSRGIAAAFALGAEGVQLGTRFVAVTENIGSKAYKSAIVAAEDTGTVITNRSLIPTRSLRTTAFTQTLLEMAHKGATAQDIIDFMGYAPSRRAGFDGDLDNGEAYCGASAGLIDNIIDVKEVISNLVEGYADVIKQL